MPVRFTTPSLGGRGQRHLEARHWELTVAYRRLDADKWFTGTKVNEFDSLPLLGQPMYVKVNSLDFTAAYGLTRKLSLALTVPFSSGSHSRFYGDSARHSVSASGLGDINLVASQWLWDPMDHGNGNLAFGLGVKAPTGTHDEMGPFWGSPTVTTAPKDQSVQTSDGGWGVMLETHGFRRLARGTFGFVSGNYLMSTKESAGVPFRYGTVVAVADVYSARMGVAYAPWDTRDVSFSVGARVDGMTAGDVIGGRDNAYRRPGAIFYAEPGLAVSGAIGTFRLSMPIRVYQNLGPDRSAAKLDGGDLADYLLFASYTRGF